MASEEDVGLKKKRKFLSKILLLPELIPSISLYVDCQATTVMARGKNFNEKSRHLRLRDKSICSMSSISLHVMDLLKDSKCSFGPDFSFGSGTVKSF